MRINERIIYIIFFILITSSFACLNSYSQAGLQNPSRQAAMDAYTKGDFEKAYSEFNILLQNYSRDPLYKYYLGVCLVKMERHPENASAYLHDALNGSLELKSIPDDAWFYLGRAQQMSGKYTDAIKSYNNFEGKAGKKRARDLNISGYIEECNESRGQIKDVNYQQNDLLSKVSEPAKEQKVSDVISSQQPVQKPVSRKEDLPEEYDKVLSQAMDYQVKADSLNTLVAESKKEYTKLPVSRQPAAKQRISELESKASEYQKLADEKFGNSGTAPAARKDVFANPSLPDPVQSAGIYSLFKVETNPELIRNQKISIDPELPGGLIYRIQMGVFSKPLEFSFFKGLSPVSGFRVSGTGSTKYFVGMFRKVADASRSLLIVKQLGFRDSFIAAILDGKPVSLERASLLENEWGQKPLISKAPVKNAGEAEASTLVFRVEVTRSVKPVGDEVAESYKKLAGNNGFDIIKTEDGSLAYLIGKFITFETASEYAGLLNRNGYREAKVVAYAGNREIPVETARRLFEK
jgi:tetratricopeptide (TPR) repeat protein